MMAHLNTDKKSTIKKAPPPLNSKENPLCGPKKEFFVVGDRMCA